MLDDPWRTNSCGPFQPPLKAPTQLAPAPTTPTRSALLSEDDRRTFYQRNRKPVDTSDLAGASEIYLYDCHNGVHRSELVRRNQRRVCKLKREARKHHIRRRQLPAPRSYPSTVALQQKAWMASFGSVEEKTKALLLATKSPIRLPEGFRVAATMARGSARPAK